MAGTQAHGKESRARSLAAKRPGTVRGPIPIDGRFAWGGTGEDHARCRKASCDVWRISLRLRLFFTVTTPRLTPVKNGKSRTAGRVELGRHIVADPEIC